MRHAVTGFKLAFCLSLLSAAPAFTQITSDEAVSNTSAAPVAYVYVQTTKGVNLYDAAANGKLTLVEGSPFKTVGEMIGSNGKYFITLGTDYVHSYKVASNGAIEEQVSEINTQNYSGGNCGTTSNAFLDHTGQNLYVLLNTGRNGNYEGPCAAYQTYDITKGSGELTFNGAAVGGQEWVGRQTTLTGNNVFAFQVGLNVDQKSNALYEFKRGSSGTLDSWSFNETDPTPQSGWAWNPWQVVADSSNHLAVVLYAYPTDYDGGGYNQLASYTVDSEGNITSTNTWENMLQGGPAPGGIISPSNKILVFFGGGLTLYHFNGADPITLYTTLTPSPVMDQVQWDHNNHMYALSDPDHKLYVYTVTPTSITEAPGSPYHVETVASDSESQTKTLVVVTRLPWM